MLDFLDFLENRSLVSLQYLENGRFRQEIKKKNRRAGTESWPENGRYWQMQKGKYACQKLQRLNHVGYVILKSNVKLNR